MVPERPEIPLLGDLGVVDKTLAAYPLGQDGLLLPCGVAPELYTSHAYVFCASHVCVFYAA